MNTAIVIGAAGVVLIVCAAAYGIYLRIKITAPLARMKEHAERIAGGDFERPEGVGADNAYGMFSESFGIMCDELSRSQQREADLRKKEIELIRALGGDLKEPVEVIRQACDLMSQDSADSRLDEVYEAADRMDDLVTTRLTAALDALGEYEVVCSDVDSNVLRDIVLKNDDRNLVRLSTIPQVLIHIDTKRMNQVIGNIITNSYQYANTQMDVAFLLTDDFLQMKISDHGGGVASDELKLITKKFYRSRKGAGMEDGSGLGLYTASRLMEEMGGSLICENADDGLLVTLLIKLS